jgi:predicted nucleotide-binding protein
MMSMERSNLPRLTMTREEASKAIQERIEKGTRMLSPHARTLLSYEGRYEAFYRWDSFNNTMLKKLFSTCKVADEEYNVPVPILVLGQRSSADQDRELQDSLRRCIRDLDIIIDKLPLYEECAPVATLSSEMQLRDSRSVFVVHGRTEGLREAVARLLSNLGLDPIILCEQTNQGRTIIEKFEDHADVGYAVVLLTPDDEGRLATSDAALSPRARQNVIFELGYFIGRLGRKRVCVIVEEGVEVPSDIAGLGYVSRDPKSYWKYQLASELKSAGYAVTLDNVR